MKGYNKVIEIGRLGADPEFGEKGEVKFAKLRLAITESVKKKESTEWEDETTWLNVTCFNQNAQFSKDYLQKGDSILIEGKLRNNKWQDADGVEHYGLDIIATKVALNFKSSKNLTGDDKPESSVDKNIVDDPLGDIE